MNTKSHSGVDTLDLQMEVKFSDSDQYTFEGYGAVYNNVDAGHDIIVPGAFSGTLAKAQAGQMPKMLWQHDPSQPIGAWTALASESKGLHVKGKILPSVAKGAEVYALMKEKAVDGLSIGYVTKDFERDGGIRKLKSLNLFEISVVTFPMNAEALISDVKNIQSIREIEHILREAGVPGAFAKLVAAHGFDEAKARLSSDQRDADEGQMLSSIMQQLNQLKEKMK